MKRVFILLFFSMLGTATYGFVAADQNPADNAALRYWMAFAEMKDSTITLADTIRMDAMINGGSSWDEAKFGHFVEENQEAVETMIRATKLPYCEWGLETSLGPKTPIAHLAKGRALARLNVVYAMRLASQDQYQGAVRSTIAGLRFAQDLAKGNFFGGIFATRSAVIPQLLMAKQLAESKHLSSQDLADLRAAVGALPEGVVDWSSAARMEEQAFRSYLVTLSHQRDSMSFYEKWFDNTPPAHFHPPTSKDLEAMDRATEHFAKMLDMTPEKAEAEMPVLQKEMATLDPVLRPYYFDRVLAARTAVVKAQRSAAEALGLTIR